MNWRSCQALDCFNKLESLIDAGGTNAVEEARTLLRRFEGCSQLVSTAIDDLLIELMTLVFLVEGGSEPSQNSARRLARIRLSKVKLLLANP
ncbi:MAG: hypothetical protein E5V96_09845 [Mesorhizobium sp.]|nr:MAG: hypothetical protein E5V96_09845 [Mesorhizobium sp.]